jgi:hypothetical protein
MKISVHHEWCNQPVIIATDEGMVAMLVEDGVNTAGITISSQEARAIAGVLLVVAEEAER